MTRTYTEKGFYRRALQIAVPIIIQNGITQFVNMLDNIYDAAIKEDLDAMRPAAPEVTPEPVWEKEIADKIAFIKSEPHKIGKYSFMQELIIGDLKNISTAFGRELTLVIHKAMERYNYNTEDERYLKFEDRTDEYLQMYNENINCIKLPNGLILEENNYRFWDKFIIKGGLVYEKHAGPLHHPKRTKKSKKINEYR